MRRRSFLSSLLATSAAPLIDLKANTGEKLEPEYEGNLNRVFFVWEQINSPYQFPEITALCGHLPPGATIYVLAPMDKASSSFFEKVLQRENLDTNEQRYRNALYHLLASETSCYRYWGQGLWTDYGAEMARRAGAIVEYDY